MSMIGFPLLLIPLAVVNILVFLMPDVSLTAPVVSLALPSGMSWTVTLSDILLTLGMLLLIFEMMKAARPGAKYFTDHLLSLIVLGGAAAEFAMLPQFGTSTYFLLTVLVFVDFVSSIVIRSRRSRQVMRETVPVVVEPPRPAVVPVLVEAEPVRSPEPAPVHHAEPSVATLAPAVDHLPAKPDYAAPEGAPDVVIPASENPATPAEISKNSEIYPQR